MITQLGEGPFYMNYRRSLFLFILVLTVLVFSGCEDKESILGQYAGGRLGVILETDELPIEPSLETTLINYIKKRIDLQVVNPKLLADSGPYYLYSDEHFYRDQLGLDLLLIVKVSNINISEAKPSIRVWSKNLDVKVTNSCSLTLSYTLRDLHSTEIIHLGQSHGFSEDSTRIRAGESGIHFNFKEVNHYELIEKAMLKALRATDLL